MQFNADFKNFVINYVYTQKLQMEPFILTAEHKQFKANKQTHSCLVRMMSVFLSRLT